MDIAAANKHLTLRFLKATLNSSSNITDKDDTCTSFKISVLTMECIFLYLKFLLRGQSNDKATGMDGLSGESSKFADPIAVSFSICFT